MANAKKSKTAPAAKVEKNSRRNTKKSKNDTASEAPLVHDALASSSKSKLGDNTQQVVNSVAESVLLNFEAPSSRTGAGENEQSNFEAPQSQINASDLLNADAPISQNAVGESEWGSDHPHRHSSVTVKIPFSAQEVAYLQSYFASHADGKGNLVARCLQHIKADPAARPIFHEKHIASSDRLRSCYRSHFKNLLPDSENDQLRNDGGYMDPDDSAVGNDPQSWGLDHPQRFDPAHVRVRFSKAELAYMRSFKEHFFAAMPALQSEYASLEWKEAPGMRTRRPHLVSACLDAIRSDPELRRIFHHRHVVKPDRLRSGFKKHLGWH